MPTLNANDGMHVHANEPFSASDLAASSPGIARSSSSSSTSTLVPTETHHSPSHQVEVPAVVPRAHSPIRDLSLSPSTSFSALSLSSANMTNPIPDVADAVNPGVTTTSTVNGRPGDRIAAITAFLLARTTTRPLVGIICGSGLGGLADCVTHAQVFKYSEIPQFPRPTVEGHAGELLFGQIGEVPVVCMRGRIHSYEGVDIRETTLPVRVMALLGVQYLLVTNAAGGLNPEYDVGDIMVMGDHINMPGLAGKHPLVGPNDERFGPRFLPLLGCYTQALQDIAYAIAERQKLGHSVRRNGVYCYVSGPSYETPAECRFLRIIGCDAVGMSTVPEATVAAHCGMKVLGMSLITNKSILPGEPGVAPSHEEVLEATKATASMMVKYVEEIIVEVGNQHHDVAGFKK